jgi:hypothetical protein
MDFVILSAAKNLESFLRSPALSLEGVIRDVSAKPVLSNVEGLNMTGCFNLSGGF